MNKQSNIYTIIYIVVLVLVVGTALAFTALTLKPKQQENIDADKMSQILAAALIPVENGNILDTYNSHVERTFTINSQGEVLYGVDAFTVDVDAQSKKQIAERELPVFEVKAIDGQTKYVLPVYGAGLWGPIWGYVAFDTNGQTIYGAYFAHQGETPGLGAEIEKEAFRSQFKGKNMFASGEFHPIAVVKAGQRPANGEDYVDGVSGGTITSKGVGAMLDNCLTPYKAFLTNLSR